MDERRLILAVCGGPLRGRKAALRPGEALSVGRSDLSGFAVPQDERLSAKHFELSWDGARARLRDLCNGTARGTRLNGETVADAEVPHGGWIRAGETNFTVHVEGRTPPRAEDDDDEAAGDPAAAAPKAIEDEPPFPVEEPESEPDDPLEAGDDDEQRWNAWREARRARLERALRQGAVGRALPILEAETAREPIHVILDAARTPRILEVLREAVEPHHSLYEGVQGEALDEVAPYLVRLEPGSRLLAQLVREGWMRRWGIYTEGAVQRRELRRHLRRFLMVQDDGGKPLYFRFYDPGVLRDFWPSCSRRQLVELIGPLRAFLVEGERGEVLRLTATGKAEPVDER